MGELLIIKNEILVDYFSISKYKIHKRTLIRKVAFMNKYSFKVYSVKSNAAS